MIFQSLTRAGYRTPAFPAPVALIFFCLFALAGCGGGGGSSGGGQAIAPVQPGSQIAGAARERNAGEIAAQAGRVADNAPNEGSVTQSSNGDGDRTDPTTTDTVEVRSLTRDPDGGYTYTLVITDGDDNERSLTQDNLDREIPSAVDVDDDFRGFELYLRFGDETEEDASDDATLYVDFHTNIEAPTVEMMPSPAEDVDMNDLVSLTSADVNSLRTGTSIQGNVFNTLDSGELDPVPGTFSCPSSCSIAIAPQSEGRSRVTSVSGVQFTPSAMQTEVTQDSDWLAGGFWLYLPDEDQISDATDIEIGAYVDGSDPFDMNNIDGLTGEATYLGDAGGIYVEQYGDSSADPAGEIDGFDASISLTAEFGADDAPGTISGTLNDIIHADGSDVDGSLIFEQAAITDLADGGFFDGDVSGTVDGIDYAGKWGGQFFGNGDAPTDHPGSVAGTFGGTGAETDTNNQLTFVGVFGADLVEPETSP